MSARTAMTCPLGDFAARRAPRYAMLAEERLEPAVAEVVPLAEVHRAHERVEAGDVPGKLVLRATDR